ncbi:nucleotide exchange factor GrpE [Legionella israelensis]|uniref:Protein GrpE n=1 Tax=Legionella israelensis TaxID=454 RepID=A0A0W0WNG9_9GAMM|nr:nucleotide exchange factor GrpE [Legionella israelensis]KTD33890.1 Heat-shock protein GrpE(HSP-70 cofactor) [Legionella israelensis]QBR83617.1 nucleotide exchange factor GrpE [Legionella israelensis]QBS08943.1 nucleotide exchange factor GrpE [Legionella israelensis]SCX81983.1 molecular chaperone GrpE [Legionella israelensis DSM 19235]STX58635.1 Heat-shock protein GrpE(HSP-70 cofactor) [Legionella israelensis]
MSKKDWEKIKKESETKDTESTSSSKDIHDSEEVKASLEHPDYEALEEQLTLAEQKAHENWEKAVRAQAELDNVRKRAERDIENAHRYGMEKLITSLLPVLDSLEQALQMAEQDTSMREGLELTMKLFLDVLEKTEVKQLNPEGDVFDPQLHEAMSIQESAEVPANTVLAVFQKGYKLSDRVIRPARVIVSKNKAEKD